MRCVPNVRAGGCAASCESDLPWLQLILTIWERQGDTGPKPPVLAYPIRRSPAFVPVQLQVLISGPGRVRTLLP